MKASIEFNAALAQCPLIAILRGITPEEAEVIGDTLWQCGLRIIEVPLNSPRPLESIERIARRLEGRAVVGAGTVTSVAQIEAVAAAGGSLIVSPHLDLRIVQACAAQRILCVPGVSTPSECFLAIEAGVHALKLFPAEASSPAALKSLRAVLPRDTRVLPVGGITPETMATWLAAGADGFGIGSALFRPGLTAAEVATRADAFVSHLKAHP
ncbi:2-dehydro-3-deoxy-6-phosphogalactonate aldolase [Steroidobacter agaridevorans]|uniref:2-dehydro-3-deoxy-6-phosphogalactonate aldolase n=1 Tax=Steroidobacter agaridevorans TaxID=2695856 RepID=A0A829Y7N9_9GAMM|nr:MULTISPECIES: 2-dehydro-3-deoxy-6-phosphogalactonate aldolase [Steroidobacteraceae]GFE79220.1 2-dehydro-3-deoxy-6-phosphogalactonate aldolase [Steroidobacter agaridevorans]GFE87261.1 2-dehydro-3-deoxy-6-phosphogalactonate aldolase [Steroidobacter agaridevorans]